MQSATQPNKMLTAADCGPRGLGEAIHTIFEISIRQQDAKRKNSLSTDHASLSQIEIQMLVSIARHERQKLRCCIASFQTLADEWGISRRSAMRGIKSLVERGLISQEFRGQRKPSRMVVNWVTVTNISSDLKSLDRKQTGVSESPLVTEGHPLVTESARTGDCVSPEGINEGTDLGDQNKSNAAFQEWVEVLRRIQPELNPQTFATWFRPTRGLRFRGGNGSMNLQVLARSHVAKSWLESPDARSVIESATEYKIEFVLP